MVHLSRTFVFVEFFIISQGWIEKALGCYTTIFLLLRDLGGSGPRDICNESAAFYLGLVQGAYRVRGRWNCVTSCYVSCDLISLSVIEWLQRAAGNYCEDTYSKAISHLLSLITEDTVRLTFLPGTHAVDMLQLVWRERQGAESHSVCPVWAGTSFKYNQELLFWK